MRNSYLATLLLIAAVLFSACGKPAQPAPAGRPAQTPVAVAERVEPPAPTPAAPAPSDEAPGNQGGVTAPEPATAGAPTAAPAASGTSSLAGPPALAAPASETPVTVVTAVEPAAEPLARPAAPEATAQAAQPSATVAPAASPTAPTEPPPAQATAAAPPTAGGVVAASSSGFSEDPHPLQIEVMRGQAYPGSAITFEQTLAPGANYTRYVVSYFSDGYKIYALMTIPSGQKPATGWPVIVFNHGYIPPAQYRTTERYVAYVDAIARNGYIVFKSDYRGHGSSEGPTTGGGYGSPGYTDDVLNAVASLKAYKDADPQRIGMWGHSMGGQLTLRAMVVSQDIRAGVIWGGVVAPYPDIFGRGTSPARSASGATAGAFGGRRGWRQELTEKYGSPEQNPAFWASISPNSYLSEISGPLQLHHSVTDEEVPVAASRILYQEAQALGSSVDLFTYPGDNHNISGNFNVAMQRTVTFFDQHVKGAG